MEKGSGISTGLNSSHFMRLEIREYLVESKAPNGACFGAQMKQLVGLQKPKPRWQHAQANRFRARLRARRITATMFNTNVSPSKTSTVPYNNGLVFSTSGDCVANTYT